MRSRRFSSKALLRQPGGFEGFFAFEEPHHANDLAVPNRPYQCERPLNLYPARSAAPMPRHDGDHPVVARVDQLLIGIVDAFPGLVPLTKERPKALVALVDARVVRF